MNKWDERYLSLAKEISTWSKDPSTQIGAVVVKDGQILSVSYNGLPRNIEDSHDRLNDRELKYSLVVHAEQNAIYNACLNGVSLKDSTLYVFGLPVCSECAKGVIQVGISRVVMDAPNISEKWKTSFEKTKLMFDEANIEFLLFGEDYDNYQGRI